MRRRGSRGSGEAAPTRRAAGAALLAALLALAGAAGADPADGLAPLADGPHAWLGQYLGKVAVASSRGAGGQLVETCSAVVVHPEWVLTAAHCVHARDPAGRPWTPAHFTGMHPLGSLVYAPHPVGRAGLYGVVDYRLSDRFPDPGAATEDWVFLRLDRPLAVDPARVPRVVPSRGGLPGGAVRVAGFLRSFTAAGTLDFAASNAPRLAASDCRVSPYVDRVRGPMAALMAVDCIPPAGGGLSGGPLVAFDPGAASGAIIGLQMGAGELAASGRPVPVLVRSERFIAAYRAIVAGRDLALRR